MLADVAMRRLSFSAPQQGVDTSDVSGKLKDLTSGIAHLSSDVQTRVDTLKAAAVKQQQLGGGKQSLKRQLQSLKSSLLNLGQKETFSESILGFYEGLDYKSEADRSAGAVEAAEEDLKELKKANEQDLQQLQEAIRMVSSYHEQYTTTMAQLSHSLEASRLGVQQLQDRRATANTAVTEEDLDEEVDLEELLAFECSRATELEANIAEANARSTDLSSALTAEVEAEQQRRIEADALHELKQDEAKANASKKFDSSLKWYNELLSIVTLPWSGISDVDVEEDLLIVKLSQRIPTGMPTSTSTGGRCGVDAPEATVAHTLSISLDPATGRLSSASLQPPSFDILGDVECARFLGGGGSLSYLVTSVRGHVRDHFRRQLLIDAASTYTIRPSLGSSVVRAQLPASGLEANVDVPFGWPDNGSALKLVAVESASTSVDCTALLASMCTAAPQLLGEGSLRLSLSELLNTADVVAQPLHR